MKRINSTRAFLLLLLVAIAVVSLYNVIGFIFDLELERRGHRTAQVLRKLDIITLGLVRSGNIATSAEVWRIAADSIPRKDPWGEEFRMLQSGNEIIWGSAGPDKKWNSKDDIRLPVAIVEASLPDKNRVVAVPAIAAESGQ